MAENRVTFYLFPYIDFHWGLGMAPNESAGRRGNKKLIAEYWIESSALYWIPIRVGSYLEEGCWF